MRRKFKITLVVLILVAISMPSILLYASGTERFIFSQSLHVEEFTYIEPDSYVANITDSGARTANVYVRLEHPPPNSTHIPILVSVWHAEDTEIDSISLKFSTYPNYAALYLEAPQSAWPEAEFHQFDGAQGVMYSVKDLGFFGEGTVTLKFMLVQFSQYIYLQNDLQFTADFSMHKKTFLQLTSLKAQAAVSIPIPN